VYTKRTDAHILDKRVPTRKKMLWNAGAPKGAQVKVKKTACICPKHGEKGFKRPRPLSGSWGRGRPGGKKKVPGKRDCYRGKR